MSPATVGLYVRSSVPDQTASQLQGLRAFATARGWHTFEYVEQGGVTGERPGLETMLADARGGRIAAVVCMSVDRLTRSCTRLASVIEELTDLGIALVAVNS
jgi:DNA invertase Pin-like site-specific DNA recombinase